jgi:hypothetical protein
MTKYETGDEVYLIPIIQCGVIERIDFDKDGEPIYTVAFLTGSRQLCREKEIDRLRSPQ